MSSRRPSVITQFLQGLLALPRGLHFIWTTRASWPVALVPVMVCGALCLVSIVAAIEYIPKLLLVLWPSFPDTLGHVGAGVLKLLSVSVSALLGMYLATFITPALSAPALDHLVLLREKSLGAPERKPAGFWRELSAALKAQLIAIAVFSPVLLVLTIMSWLLPPIAAVTVPLHFLVLAALFAWSLLDYPLSLRGAPVRRRVGLMTRSFARVLGFGIALVPVFALPFLPLLLLPAAVAAAAEIAVALERDED